METGLITFERSVSKPFAVYGSSQLLSARLQTRVVSMRFSSKREPARTQ
jgi:hypothetical protein